MKKRLLLLIIFLMFIFSSLSFIFIINYLDPYEYMVISMIFIIFSFVLWISSFFTLLLFFFKKVYYRWNCDISVVINSFRQWFLISLFIIWILIFNRLWAWILISWLVLFIFLFFIELLIQNMSE